MRKLFNSVLLTLILIGSLPGQSPELRGVWIAWAGSNVPSKTKIAQMMDDLATHHFNTVYVDVWRFGFPYFRSELFHRLTGIWTDPALDDGRDVLAEMIAEGHRVGLHVEAWFEYGFVAGHGENDHLYRVRPDWFAQKADGTIYFNGDYRWKWLSHCHPEAQQFLIDLCQEVALKYDIDGLELDRIRYPELDCGYDPATIAWYRQEHQGNAPPSNPAIPEWKQWRAEKLTVFAKTFHDSLKAVRPDLPLSNAPVIFSYGYENFCQDWRPWINNGSLDFVSPQVYRATNAIYKQELEKQMLYVQDLKKLYPGITTVTDYSSVATDELIAMIETTRRKGLAGHVIWFYDTLVDDLPRLKETVYPQPVSIPSRPVDWRRPALIMNEDAASVTRSPGWTAYTALSGYQGGCQYVKASGDEWIDYHTPIPATGWYEVYTFVVYHWNATTTAPYLIYSRTGVDTVLVNQRQAGIARWYKLGDFYFTQGENQKIIRLSNTGIANQLLFTDAVMLLNTNRPLAQPSSMPPESIATQPGTALILMQNYPNPFNTGTLIQFTIPAPDRVDLKIFDLAGQLLAHPIQGQWLHGSYALNFTLGQFASGIYFYQLQVGNRIQTKKMIVVK
ncbi:family 10 glycosylhydrolase [candidate division KSB1 bacterium]|nr:family 10 glycosylhydrolase [candidate division KSB1 bacterium]